MHRSEHPATMDAVQRVVDQHTKGKQKKTITSDETKQLKNKERRETFLLPGGAESEL